MKIDWDKDIQTRDGKPARLICRDALSNSLRPYVVLVDMGSYEEPITYGDRGDYTKHYKGENPNLDIINVPQEHEVMLLMCNLGDALKKICKCTTNDEKRNQSCYSYGQVIAKKKITITEGEGM